MSDILFRRLGYFLSPQLDIYKHIAKEVKGQRVLDIGFGTGFGSLQFVGIASEIIGTDVDPGSISFANTYIPGVSFYWGDIQRPVTHLARDMDMVLLIEVLEHIPDWRAALKNAAECLKPGGRLILSARNANADLRKNDLHEREWTAQEVIDSLSPFFAKVELFDYTLTNKLSPETRTTPVLAVATKGER